MITPLTTITTISGRYISTCSSTQKSYTSTFLKFLPVYMENTNLCFCTIACTLSGYQVTVLMYKQNSEADMARSYAKGTSPGCLPLGGDSLKVLFVFLLLEQRTLPRIRQRYFSLRLLLSNRALQGVGTVKNCFRVVVHILESSSLKT